MGHVDKFSSKYSFEKRVFQECNHLNLRGRGTLLKKKATATSLNCTLKGSKCAA